MFLGRGDRDWRPLGAAFPMSEVARPLRGQTSVYIGVEGRI